MRLTGDGLDPLDLDVWDDGSVVTSVEVGGPNVRESVIDRPGVDGTDDRTVLVGARAVTIGVTLTASPQTRRALVDRMGPFMHPGRRLTLHMAVDGVTRRLVVRPEPVSLPWDRPGVLEMTWSFRTVGSPFFAGEARVLALQPSLPPPGRSYDLVRPRVYPEGTVTLAVAFQGGDTPAAWVATIHGPCTGPAVRNEDTGATVALPGLTLTAGQTAVVDSGARTVTVDGEPRYQAIDPRLTTWWLLPPGTTPVRAPMATASGDAMVDLAWSDTFYA